MITLSRKTFSIFTLYLVAIIVCTGVLIFLPTKVRKQESEHITTKTQTETANFQTSESTIKDTIAHPVIKKEEVSLRIETPLVVGAIAVLFFSLLSFVVLILLTRAVNRTAARLEEIVALALKRMGDLDSVKTEATEQISALGKECSSSEIEVTRWGNKLYHILGDIRNQIRILLKTLKRKNTPLEQPDQPTIKNQEEILSSFTEEATMKSLGPIEQLEAKLFEIRKILPEFDLYPDEIEKVEQRLSAYDKIVSISKDIKKKSSQSIDWLSECENNWVKWMQYLYMPIESIVEFAKELLPNAIDRFKEFLDISKTVIDESRKILTKIGFKQIPAGANQDPFYPEAHKLNKYVNTQKPSLRGIVAKEIEPGFWYTKSMDKEPILLKPALVDVYQFATDQHEKDKVAGVKIPKELRSEEGINSETIEDLIRKAQTREIGEFAKTIIKAWQVIEPKLRSGDKSLQQAELILKSYLILGEMANELIEMKKCSIEERHKYKSSNVEKFERYLYSPLGRLNIRGISMQQFAKELGDRSIAIQKASRDIIEEYFEE